MHILLALLWWAGISHAAFKPGMTPVCLEKKAWRMPKSWNLPSNNFIRLFNENNRPWRAPLMKTFIEQKIIPGDVVLPSPLLPTTDVDLLELYSEAIRCLAEDEATPLEQRTAAEDAFLQDRACWDLEEECQNNGYMFSWPYWSCSGQITKVPAQWFNWHSSKARELDDLTISLLRRAYRYALLELAGNLTREVTHIGYFPLSKRTPYQDRDPVADGVIPKFAKCCASLVRFYTDPVHRAEHHEIREPHLPGYIVPPTPLLSTIDNVFSKTDKKIVNLYRDALRAYDEEHTLDDSQIRQRWETHMDESWNWITQDPCYYDRNDCNIYQRLATTWTRGWYTKHDVERVRFKALMEHIGLVDLGTHLILEALESKGSRRDLQRLLSQYWDHDGIVTE